MRWSGIAAVPVCQMTLIISGPFYRYTFQKRLGRVTRIAPTENSGNQSHERNPMNQNDPRGRKNGHRIRLFHFSIYFYFILRGDLGETMLTAGREGKLQNSIRPLTPLQALQLSDVADLIYTPHRWLHQSIPPAPLNEFIFRTNFKSPSWCITA